MRKRNLKKNGIAGSSLIHRRESFGVRVQQEIEVDRAT